MVRSDIDMVQAERDIQANNDKKFAYTRDVT